MELLAKFHNPYGTAGMSGGELCQRKARHRYVCVRLPLGHLASMIAVQSRTSRNKNRRMLESIAESRFDEFGILEKKHRQPCPRSTRKPKKKRTRIADDEAPHVLEPSDDGEDDAYETVSDDDGSASPSEVEVITDDNLSNDEVF